jgi:hypothetical protein
MSRTVSAMSPAERLRDYRCPTSSHVIFWFCGRASPNATRKKVLLHAHARVRTAVVCLMTASARAKAESCGRQVPEIGAPRQDETRVRRYDEVFRSAAIRKQTDHRAKARTKLGGVMTGLGSVTAICANSLSSISSSTDVGLIVTDPNSPLNSSSVLSARHFSGRLADHMACTFTTGIRGTAPPPLG